MIVPRGRVAGQAYTTCPDARQRLIIYLVHLHWSSYAIGLPVVDLGYETTHRYPTLDR